MARIRGDFCERGQSPRRAFDRRSFRWKRSGAAWVLVGCPRGQYDARRATCRVGTRAYKVLAPAPRTGACPVGRRVEKR